MIVSYWSSENSSARSSEGSHLAIGALERLSSCCCVAGSLIAPGGTKHTRLRPRIDGSCPGRNREQQQSEMHFTDTIPIRRLIGPFSVVPFTPGLLGLNLVIQLLDNSSFAVAVRFSFQTVINSSQSHMSFDKSRLLARQFLQNFASVFDLPHCKIERASWYRTAGSPGRKRQRLNQVGLGFFVGLLLTKQRADIEIRIEVVRS